MVILNVLFVAAVILVLVAALYGRKEDEKFAVAIICVCLAIVFFGVTTYLGGPQELGQGIVSIKAKPLTNRLSLDTPYEIVSTIPDGGTKILVIKALGEKSQDGVTAWYAIRVDEKMSVPKDFTLTDGYPVASEPSSAVSQSTAQTAQ